MTNKNQLNNTKSTDRDFNEAQLSSYNLMIQGINDRGRERLQRLQELMCVVDAEISESHQKNEDS
jgi:hypothetical protein